MYNNEIVQKHHHIIIATKLDLCLVYMLVECLYFHLSNISILNVTFFSKRRDKFVLWGIRDEYDRTLNYPMIGFTKSHFFLFGILLFCLFLVFLLL